MIKLNKMEEQIAKLVDKYLGMMPSDVNCKNWFIMRLNMIEEIKQLQLYNVVESKPSTKAALNASVSAIYFADNSDYKSYHYEVIRSLTKLDEPTDEDIRKLYEELNPE